MCDAGDGKIGGTKIIHWGESNVVNIAYHSGIEKPVRNLLGTVSTTPIACKLQ